MARLMEPRGPVADACLVVGYKGAPLGPLCTRTPTDSD